MWRPEGWECPYKVFRTLHGGAFSNSEDIFEEGADAMLKKLIAGGFEIKSDGTSIIPAQHGFPEIRIEGKPFDKGWIVYIPKEEE